MARSEKILNDIKVDESCEIPAESLMDPNILNSIFDHIPLTMILVNTGGKIENINRAASIKLGKEKKDCVDLLGGELFGCMNSLKEEGCGKNRECSECTVRNSVMHTFETGENIYKKESELEIMINDRSATLHLLISTISIKQDNESMVLLIADDITEQKLAEKKVLEASVKAEKAIQQYADIFENVRIGLYVYYLENLDDDRTLRLIAANPAASDFTGVPNEVIFGKTLDEIYPGLREKDIPQTYAEVVRTGQSRVLEDIYYGDERVLENTFSVKVFPLPNNCVGIAFDNITERKKAEEAMLQAKLTAEDANRTKSEFISNMSHELRTPLTSIIGFSDLLISENFGTLNESQKKYTSNVLRSGKHLLELINALLDFSKIEAGKMELILEEFAIQDAINEIKETMMPLAMKKEIELNYSINVKDPIIVADSVKFKQILYNLVSNAIKFTDQGGSVTMGINTTDEIISVLVKDSGIGISSENQDKLFNPFYQVDSSNAREYEGTGLGLALVEKFVEMHGGKIRVDSEVGKGSTFTFRIPIAFENKSF